MKSKSRKSKKGVKKRGKMIRIRQKMFRNIFQRKRYRNIFQRNNPELSYSGLSPSVKLKPSSSSTTSSSSDDGMNSTKNNKLVIQKYKNLVADNTIDEYELNNTYIDNLHVSVDANKHVQSGLDDNNNDYENQNDTNRAASNSVYEIIDELYNAIHNDRVTMPSSTSQLDFDNHKMITNDNIHKDKSLSFNMKDYDDEDQPIRNSGDDILARLYDAVYLDEIVVSSNITQRNLNSNTT
jgi:hypothetical protein